VTDDDLMAVLDRTKTAILAALATVEDWRPTTGAVTHVQYAIDLVADGPAVEVLTDAGLGVLSEESGLHDAEREIVVVMDPVDGSTNASRGIPWFATSLCAVDASGPRAALVENLATGERFEAVRGRGARRNGTPIRVSGETDITRSLVCLCGIPPVRGPWQQGRVMGAGALDLCSVGAGRFDAYFDNTDGIHGPWDYLGGMLVVLEAGGVVGEIHDRDLVVLDHSVKRGPIAAASPALLEAVRAFRRSAP
jgi:fructose-1,6-bisphosphatase/inositol monophosphatase family enzyme